MVRTTVTLGPGVSARLERIARERGDLAGVSFKVDLDEIARERGNLAGVSFKVDLNDAIRAGPRPGPGTEPSHRVRDRDLALRAGIDPDRALRLADGLEDAELARRLEL